MGPRSFCTRWPWWPPCPAPSRSGVPPGPSSGRLPAVWEILAFVLNALVFALVGLQLSRIVDALNGQSAGSLMWWGALVAAAVVATRLVWGPILTLLPKLLFPRLRHGVRITPGQPAV